MKIIIDECHSVNFRKGSSSHRGEGPSLVSALGKKSWHTSGVLDREGAPAMISPSGKVLYAQKSSLHNKFGPAYMAGIKHASFYLDGMGYSHDVWRSKAEFTFEKSRLKMGDLLTLKDAWAGADADILPPLVLLISEPESLAQNTAVRLFPQNKDDEVSVSALEFFYDKAEDSK